MNDSPLSAETVRGSFGLDQIRGEPVETLYIFRGIANMFGARLPGTMMVGVFSSVQQYDARNSTLDIITAVASPVSCGLSRF